MPASKRAFLIAASSDYKIIILPAGGFCNIIKTDLL